MHRRNARLRREYLYKKSLERPEREREAKKAKVRQSIEGGATIPAAMADEVTQLRHEIELDDTRTRAGDRGIDDEYATAGVHDPSIFVTTSRNPSSRLMQFVKEMKLVIPNSRRINRGSHVVSELVEACRANDVTDLVVFHEHRGEPDGMIVSHLPYGPTAYFGIFNCVLRHDIRTKSTMPLVFPHLIFHNLSSPLGLRIQNVLKYIFPVPKEDSPRVITFANDRDFISFRHHVYEKTSHKDVELTEIGPRFELKPYQIKLGTLDMTEADTEWALKPYMNSSKRRSHLSSQ